GRLSAGRHEGRRLLCDGRVVCRLRAAGRRLSLPCGVLRLLPPIARLAALARMKITAVDTFFVEVPQKYPIAPYQSRYRPQSSKKSVLVRIETDQGITGWGETPQRYLGEQFTGQEGRMLTDQLRGH